MNPVEDVVHGVAPQHESGSATQASPGPSGNDSEMKDGNDALQIVRIRNHEDMEYLTDYIREHHAMSFKRAEKVWAREGSLNGTDCRYLERVKGQPTPLNFNRWLVFFLFLLMVFARGCTYWGWNGMQDLLYKSGAFAWQCKAGEPGLDMLKIGDDFYVDCPERKNAINDLYTAAFASNFMFSAVGGLILDAIGPKWTLLGAILVDGTGWGLLAGSSESVVAYVPALVFIGMAADPGYLSLLCVANLFPAKESTIMGVMGSVRSLSFAIPVIMAAVFQSSGFAPGDLWKVMVFYIVVGLGLCLVICLLLVPTNAFKGAEDFRRDDRRQQLLQMRSDLLNAMPSFFFSHWAAEGEKQADKYVLLLTKQQQKKITAMFELVEREEALLEQEATLCVALKEPRFLLLFPIFIVNLLRVEFFTKSNKEQLQLPDGRNLYTMFSVMNILSFLPGPLMGYAGDRWGMLNVMSFLNIAGIGMYVLLMPNNIPSKAISLVCFWLYASFVLSSIYCYIKTHFPNKLFGSLAGLCSLVGGTFALTSIGWYKLSTETLLHMFPRNFWPVDGVMIAGGVLVAVIIVIMTCLDRRLKRRKKVASEDKEMAQMSEEGEAEAAGLTDAEVAAAPAGAAAAARTRPLEVGGGVILQEQTATAAAAQAEAVVNEGEAAAKEGEAATVANAA